MRHRQPQAVNPVTGASLGAGSAPAIGTIVPNTGSLTNGLIKNGNGIAKKNYTWPTIVYGPAHRRGLRSERRSTHGGPGSFGLFFDRPDGDSIYPQIGNPPTSTSSVLRYSTLQSIGTGGLSTQAASALNIFQYDAKVPSATQWNLGVQMQLPSAMTLDVSYVGNHGFNLLQSPRGNTAVMDLNAPDFGAAYLPQNQDPTLAASTVPGATALLPDQLRPYIGYNSIFYFAPIYHSTYHSIQMSLNRRMRHGLQFGANYTYSMSFTGDAGAQGGTAGIGLRLNHNADGTYAVRADQAQYESLMSNMGRRPHVIKVNAVWELPKVGDDAPVKKALGYVVNDWQLSGVLTAGSGSPYDAAFTYQSNGAAINLTGSPSYNGRIVIKGDPGSGCSSDPVQAVQHGGLLGADVWQRGPRVGPQHADGMPGPHGGPGHRAQHSHWRRRQAQLRIDAFNAFNANVYSARSSTVQFVSPTDQTVRNPQFNADGTLVQTRLQPQTPASAPPPRRRRFARCRCSCGSSSSSIRSVSFDKETPEQSGVSFFWTCGTITSLKRIPSIPVVVLAALVACSPGKPPSQAPAPAASTASPHPPVPYKISLSYDDARAVLDAHQADLPASLRGRDPAAQAAAWPGWVAEHDADIRARLAHGDEDSILNLWLYGTSFTELPRATTRDLAAAKSNASNSSRAA